MDGKRRSIGEVRMGCRKASWCYRNGGWRGGWPRIRRYWVSEGE